MGDAMIGEVVVVERHVETGRDAHNQPIFDWVSESVDAVLVAPGPRADIPDTSRPEGVTVAWNLHFPKGYPATLRGARVKVRGGDPLDVIGDPQHYTLENTPTRWSMPVEVARADG